MVRSRLKAKVLLPWARTMPNFLRAKATRFLPRTHGRFRLNRS
jgi:hypothetical protein